MTGNSPGHGGVACLRFLGGAARPRLAKVGPGSGDGARAFAAAQPARARPTSPGPPASSEPRLHASSGAGHSAAAQHARLRPALLARGTHGRTELRELHLLKYEDPPS